jgi:hypothetical protein
MEFDLSLRAFQPAIPMELAGRYRAEHSDAERQNTFVEFARWVGGEDDVIAAFTVLAELNEGATSVNQGAIGAENVGGLHGGIRLGPGDQFEGRFRLRRDQGDEEHI